MTYDELCATVGALRDRVAELEAKEAARAEGDARTHVVVPGLAGDWRTMGGEPIQFKISMAGAEGNKAIQDIVAAAIETGLRSVPEIKR